MRSIVHCCYCYRLASEYYTIKESGESDPYCYIHGFKRWYTKRMYKVILKRRGLVPITKAQYVLELIMKT